MVRGIFVQKSPDSFSQKLNIITLKLPLIVKEFLKNSGKNDTLQIID